MNCPNCKIENVKHAYRCSGCNYGLAARPHAAHRKPRYLGDDGKETRDEALGRTFRCTNCRSHGGTVKRIATTGAGASRVFDFQLNEFLVVSCSFCGLVQMYDARVLDSCSTGWRIVDFLSCLD